MILPTFDLPDLPAELQELLGPRVQRLGYLGDWFRYTAHQPAALAHFIRFTGELKDALPARMVEVIALTVAVELDNVYERNQHEQLCSKLGFPDSFIRALVFGDSVQQESHLDEDELVVRRLALAAARREDLADAFAVVADRLSARDAVAALLMSARYVAHAVVASALDLAAPVPPLVSR